MLKEKDFQKKFKEFIENNETPFSSQSSAFELKCLKGKSLSLKSIGDHQIDSLIKVKRYGMYYKINDAPFFKDKFNRLRFTQKKPFDCFLLKNCQAFFVILSQKNNEKPIMYWIDIDLFVNIRVQAIEAGMKSIPLSTLIDHSCFYHQFHFKVREKKNEPIKENKNNG